MDDLPLLRLPETLTDGVILLNAYTADDAEVHAAGEDDEMLRRFDAPQRPPLEHTRNVMQRWAEVRAAGGPNFVYAMRDSASMTLVGGCELRALSAESANISYWTYAVFRGRGYAARAAALLQNAAAVVPAFKWTELHIDEDNLASRRIAAKCGFVESGTVADETWDGRTVTRLRYMRPVVHGIDLDGQTRCAHWHSPLDVIAIKMKCCGDYYACKDCHDALARHEAVVWPRTEWDERAILCGVCGMELSVRRYLDCGNVCPHCGASFNPGCRNHYHFYFEGAAD